MFRRAVTIALVVAAITIGSSASAAAVTKIEPSVASATAQADLIALINAYRASNGRQAVSPNGALTAAAAWMAGDMAVRNYIGHVSSDGRSPTQRMSASGYPATSMYTGEDLGAGYEVAGAVLAGWQASAAHNAVLLNPNYDAIGVGLVYAPSSTYKWYWVADLGGPGGTVKVIIPPAPSPLVATARSLTTQEAQPVGVRAAEASRGSARQPAEDRVDPEAAADAARIAFFEEREARRIAHLVAVLQSMGAL